MARYHWGAVVVAVSISRSKVSDSECGPRPVSKGAQVRLLCARGRATFAASNCAIKVLHQPLKHSLASGYGSRSDRLPGLSKGVRAPNHRS
jgi:hypothetical protein